MAEIKKDVCHIKKKVDQHDKDFRDNSKDHENIKDMIRGSVDQVKSANADHFEKVEKILKDHTTEAKTMFAKKWVEKFLIWAGGILGAAILVGLATLIYQMAIHINQ